MSKIKHYENTFLDTMRQQTDPLADRAVQAVYQSANPTQFRDLMSRLDRNGDPLPAGLPVAVTEFFEVTGQLPEWASAARMQQGTQFFARYGFDLMLMLGLLSLPYDYAAANGAQVLHLSQRLSYHPGKRLLETGQYVMNVTAPGAFSKRGKAIRSAQKVRLIHAAIRYHIGQGVSTPGVSTPGASTPGASTPGTAVPGSHWNPAWGQPINQEDMAGTNLSISLIPVRGLRKLGRQVAHEDMLAYIHLWNVASYIMGVDERLLPDTAKEAFVLDKAITTRQHTPSEAGQSLTQALLDYIQQSAPANVRPLAAVYMRYLLGDTIADSLAIAPYPVGEAWAINPVKGLNQLRNLLPEGRNAYYDLWTQLSRQSKYLAKESSRKFKMPGNLAAS